MSLDASSLFRNDDEEESDEEDNDYVPSGAESDESNDKEVSDDDHQGDLEDEPERKKKRGRRKQKPHGQPRDEDEDEDGEAKTKPSEDELKKKADSLWAELCSDTKAPKRSASNCVKGHNGTEVKAEAKTATTCSFAGEDVNVVDEKNEQLLEPKASSTSSDTKSTVSPKGAPAIPPKRPAGGLSSVLANLSKKPKLSTLTKTQLDWQRFKKSSGLEEELDQHNRSKGGFLERQAFLQRSDLRQFEKEKSIREKSRLSK